MSILSTSSKLVRVGDSYSAGEGISIENNVISVTGDYGHAYYPGENISISDDNVISSKDWSSDIDTAAQNVSAETTAWVSEQGYITDASLSDYALITDVETTSGLLKMDIDSVSSLVSSFDSSINSLSSTVHSNSGKWNEIEVYQTNSSTYLTAHQDISNKLDTTAFSTVSGTFLTAHQSLDGYLTKSSADTLYQPIGNYASQTDLEQVSGDLKYDIDYISGVAITAHQDISNKLDTTAFSTVSGTFLTAVDLTPYATTGDLNTASSFLSGAIDYVSANAGDEFPASANDAITAYQTYSGTYLSNASAEVTYQPIGQYASASDITGFATKNELETTSGDIVNLIPSTAGLATEQLVEDTSATITGMIPSTAGLATETDLQIVSGGVDYISGVALTSIPTGTMNITGFEYDGDDLITAYNGSAFAGQGGGSIDTIPVAVISPLVTGFSGESAYLGIESTALNLSSYVPVSAIGVDSNYGWVNKISGRNISAYNAATAQYAYTANRAYHDRNNNEITSYYQPKLTITGDAGTITSINGSAVGASIPEGWELVAGAGIEIVDDALNNQTTISVTAAGGNPEVESYVQTNSASIDDAVSTYQSNSGSYITQETDWTNTITAASSYAYSEAVAQIPAPFDPTYISGVIDNKLDKSESANFYPMTGNPSGFLTAHQDISNKLDTTAFSDVSGTFLTAVNIPESADWNDATTAYQTNSATYLTEHQPISANEWNSNYDTVNTNSSVWNDVSVYQTNSATYMTEPNLEYNAVGEISAYGNSAIAQYGAEKQWLQHDDTIVHVSNSAQYAFGCNISALQRLMGIDETVLWSGNIAGSGSTLILNESYTNFDKLAFYTRGVYQPNPLISTFKIVDSDSFRLSTPSLDGGSYYNWIVNLIFTGISGSLVRSFVISESLTSTTRTVTNGSTAGGTPVSLEKIVGIGRKQA